MQMALWVTNLYVKYFLTGSICKSIKFYSCDYVALAFNSSSWKAENPCCLAVRTEAMSIRRTVSIHWRCLAHYFSVVVPINIFYFKILGDSYYVHLCRDISLYTGRFHSSDALVPGLALLSQNMHCFTSVACPLFNPRGLWQWYVSIAWFLDIIHRLALRTESKHFGNWICSFHQVKI